MRSLDFALSIQCYTKSIELDPNEPASYSNRSMAYLKVKDYGNAINDANKALALKPDYIKAYHRRGKAYLATNKFELAIRDFQFILE